MHAAGAERDDLALTRGFLAPSRLRGDPRGLTEEAEQRGLVLRPFDVRALDAEHGLVRLEEQPLVHRPHVHRLALEEGCDFLDARENAPLPVFGEGLQVDLGLDPLAVTAMSEDLNGAREIHIGDLAALDVGVGGGVKRALRGVRHSLCDPRVTPKVAKSVAEPLGQVKPAFPGYGGTPPPGASIDHAAFSRNSAA